MYDSPDGRPPKPPHLFDRDAEWAGLVTFATDARPGATLGVVSGRRRQGKSYLLQAMATALGGIYFPALELTETVSLRLFADELIRFSGSPVPPFRDWLDAIGTYSGWPEIAASQTGRPQRLRPDLRLRRCRSGGMPHSCRRAQERRHR